MLVCLATYQLPLSLTTLPALSLPPSLTSLSRKLAIPTEEITSSLYILHGASALTIYTKCSKCKPAAHITDIKLAHAPQVDTARSL